MIHTSAQDLAAARRAAASNAGRGTISEERCIVQPLVSEPHRAWVTYVATLQDHNFSGCPLEQFRCDITNHPMTLAGAEAIVEELNHA